MSTFEMVPFLNVSNMASSCSFYVDGLGFELRDEWIVDGQRRWCRLHLNGAGLMLQQFEDAIDGRRGVGVCLYVMCSDALDLYHRFWDRGVEPGEPFVGNAMWVTSLVDPDGYHISFESPTDVAEDTLFSDWQEQQAGAS